MNSFYSFHDAYLGILRALLECKTEIAPRGIKTKEILNYSFIVENPSTDIKWEITGSPERQEVVEKYWAKELAWYLSGSLDAADTPAKFWKTLADDNGLVTSNYGHLALYEEKYENFEGESITAASRVIALLSEDPDSRQGLIHYGESRHFWHGNKDTPCCINNQFLIRDNKLQMIVNMRSNDVWFGLTYDWKWFSYLQNVICSGLAGVELGKIYYNVASMHMYEKDYAAVKKMLEWDNLAK